MSMHFATFLVGCLCLEKSIIRPAIQTTLQQQLLAIHHLKTGTMKMRFQISEQITVTRSQIWTVGRVV